MKQNSLITPIKRYYNAKTDKYNIYKDNKGKCGIYRWTNLVKGKSYIGSSISLYNRFSKYYSLNNLNKSRNSISVTNYAIKK